MCIITKYNKSLTRESQEKTQTLPSNVVNHERPCGSAVVGAGDGPEALLSRRVPDLQLDLLTAHLDYPRTKLYTDCVGAVRHDCGAKKTNKTSQLKDQLNQSLLVSLWLI